MNLETGKRLVEYRKANGFSQEELAEKIGVSRQAISKWERSESSPDTDNLIALARLYGITIDELINGTQEPKKLSDDDTADADADSSTQSGNDYSYGAGSNGEPDVNYNKGFNFQNNGDSVHVGWDGVHVESKNGDRVHVDSRGVHVNGTDAANHIYEHANSGKNPWLHVLLPISVTTLYLLFGFTLHRGWSCGWLLFFLIPIIETAVRAFHTKNPSHFAYPVFAAALFLTIGMLFYVWHPTWIIFITIPAYYALCDTYRKTRRDKYDDFSQYRNQNGGAYYNPPGAGNAVPPRKSIGISGIIISVICALTIISVVAITAVFGFLGANAGNFGSIIGSAITNEIISYENDGAYSAGSGEVPINGISEISVEWISGDIHVEYYDGETIRFEEPSQSNTDRQLRWTVDGSELKIKYCKSGLRSNYGGTKELSVYLPKDYKLNELDITGISSDVEINGINGYELDLETVSGNCSVNGTFEHISTSSVSGNTNIVSLTVPSDIDVETVSGDVVIELPHDISGFTVDYETVSGSVTGNDFYLKGSTKIGEGMQTYGDGALKIDFESVSGDLKIKEAS